MASDDLPKPLAELLDLLSLERGLIEFALFKLLEARLVYEAGETEMLPLAYAEVEQVIRRVRESAGRRQPVMVEAAKELGIEQAQLTLDHLITTGPPVLRSSYFGLKNAFVDLGHTLARVAHSAALTHVDVGPIRGLLAIALPAGEQPRAGPPEAAQPQPQPHDASGAEGPGTLAPEAEAPVEDFRH